MDQETIIAQIPNLKQEVDNLTNGVFSLQKEINSLYKFNTSHHIYSTKDLNSFLTLSLTPSTAPVTNASKSILLSIDKKSDLIPSKLLASTIIGTKNIQFNQQHNYKANFSLIDIKEFQDQNTALGKYISSHLEQGLDFNLSLIIANQDYFEPCVIQYKNNTLTFFHIGNNTDFTSSNAIFNTHNTIPLFSNMIQNKSDFLSNLLNLSINLLKNSIQKISPYSEATTVPDVIKVSPDLKISNHFIDNYWQANDISNFASAVNILEYMTEDAYHDNITLDSLATYDLKTNHVSTACKFLQRMGDEVSWNSTQDLLNPLLDSLKIKEKDIKYFTYTQSLPLIEKLAEQTANFSPNSQIRTTLHNNIKNATLLDMAWDIEQNEPQIKALMEQINNIRPQFSYHPEISNKLKYIHDYTADIVKELKENPHYAQAFNFAIYESAYKLYSETQEMFNSHSDSEIAGFILAHQFPEPEALATNLAGTIHPICTE
jgi:hypothetical protein